MVLLYQNGILEPNRANGLFFTDGEIIDIFKDFDFINSFRLSEVPNCWCIWGVNKKNIETDYNSMASYIFSSDIFSHVAFLHDSEFDPASGLTDEIIYKNYDEYTHQLMTYVNKMSMEYAETMSNNQRENNNGEPIKGQIYLDQIDQTDDNKIVFAFDMDAQSPDFFTMGSFNIFSERVVAYLTKNYDKKYPYVLLEDKYLVILIEGKNCGVFYDRIIDNFIRVENYEACELIKNIRADVIKWQKKRDAVIKKKIKQPK